MSSFTITLNPDHAIDSEIIEAITAYQLATAAERSSQAIGPYRLASQRFRYIADTAEAAAGSCLASLTEQAGKAVQAVLDTAANPEAQVQPEADRPSTTAALSDLLKQAEAANADVQRLNHHSDCATAAHTIASIARQAAALVNDSEAANLDRLANDCYGATNGLANGESSGRRYERQRNLARSEANIILHRLRVLNANAIDDLADPDTA